MVHLRAFSPLPFAPITAPFPVSISYAPDAAGPPGLFVYEVSDSHGAQRGIVGVASVDDYAAGLIKRHEKTRADREDARTRSLAALSAHTTPVQIAYRDVAVIGDVVARTVGGGVVWDGVDCAGVRHRVWRVEVRDVAVLERAFEAHVEVGYIADGHHRTASAARVAGMRGEEGSGWFLAAWFPGSQLRVLGYHRVVADLGGMTAHEFIFRVAAVGGVRKIEGVPSAPEVHGVVHMYVEGQWYAVELGGVAGKGGGFVGAVDCGRLQAAVLAPLLGISDPRRDERIEFVGGDERGMALARRVDKRGNGVAFQMCPVSLKQLMKVADSGSLMPPKSTWFSPKLASGLFVQTF